MNTTLISHWTLILTCSFTSWKTLKPEVKRGGGRASRPVIPKRVPPKGLMAAWHAYMIGGLFFSNKKKRQKKKTIIGKGDRPIISLITELHSIARSDTSTPCCKLLSIPQELAIFLFYNDQASQAAVAFFASRAIQSTLHTLNQHHSPLCGARPQPSLYHARLVKMQERRYDRQRPAYSVAHDDSDR